MERLNIIQLVRFASRCRAGELNGPYLRRCITGPCSITCAFGCVLCAFPIGSMSRASGHGGTSALMPSRACSFSWLPLSSIRLPVGPSSTRRWSSWWISYPLHRPQRCSSLSMRARHSALQPSGWRSAPCRCCGPRRRPSPLCASSLQVGAEAFSFSKLAHNVRFKAQRLIMPRFVPRSWWLLRPWSIAGHGWFRVPCQSG